MTRRKMIAGNWKCNGTLEASLELVTELKRLLTKVRDRDMVICPPYTSLHPVAKRLEDTPIGLGAQDLFFEESGAFTGAISAPMLASVGCSHVLVGHSERRQIFGETNESVNRRMKAAMAAGLTPIFCVGETLAERESGSTMNVVAEQVDGGLEGIDDISAVIIAYEPVWAIGTGRVASPEQAQEVHAAIRERIRARSTAVAQSMRILYGGSVKPDNAAQLFTCADIDGGLIGGASLDASAFAKIVQA